MDDCMTITFLGTGTSQGVPVIGSRHPVCLSEAPKDKRLRGSGLVCWGEFRYVIDCGAGFSQEMLTNSVSTLDGILFTHEHADHTAGIDDIRPFFFRQGDIPIYAHQRVLDCLKRRFDYIFADENRYPGAPAVQIHTVSNDEPFAVGDQQAIPVEAFHNRLQVFGYRIGDFAYLTDVKKMDEKERMKIRGVDVLVVNALREEAHHSHFNLEEALEFSEDIGAKRTYFTHISHLLGFHEEVQAKLPENVFLAYDNLKVKVALS